MRKDTRRRIGGYYFDRLYFSRILDFLQHCREVSKLGRSVRSPGGTRRQSLNFDIEIFTQIFGMRMVKYERSLTHVIQDSSKRAWVESCGNQKPHCRKVRFQFLLAAVSS